MQNDILGKCRRKFLYASGAALLFGAAGFSQDAAIDEEDEIFELSPFTVEGSEDEGYRATSTLAGTRIRTDLKDVGSAISVYTEQFISDIGATDTSSLLQYTTNAEVSGTLGTYAGLGNGAVLDEGSRLLAPHTSNRIRGLSAAENTRDYFVTDIPWDSYVVDRVDVQRGANSMLFGLGSPAGIVNATLAGASFADEAKVDLRFGSYGSRRASASLNKVVIEDTLAIRVGGLWDHEEFQQEPAFENDERVYVALRYDPKIFADDSFSTSINAKFENGNIKANRPRVVPPMDSVSPWFRPKAVTADNPFGGMDRLIVNNLYDSWVTYQAKADPDNYQAWLSGAGLNSQQPIYLIDGETGDTQGIRAGYINVGARNPDGTLRNVSDGLLGKRYSGPFLGVAGLDTAASDLGLPLASYGQYRAMSVTDPGVFNFYDTLIDGDTKSEFEDWNAFNVDFSQTALDDRLGLQLIYDEQRYKRGGEALLGYRPTLQVDTLQNWDDLSPNPNVGRPFVTTNSGGDGSSFDSYRSTFRASLFAELRATDFLDQDSFLARLLGKHRFTAVHSDDNYRYENLSWNRKANTQAWDAYWNGNSGATSGFQNRPPVGIIYLGDSLVNASAANQANIPGIGGNVDMGDGSVYVFDSTWTAGSSVAYNAPWTVPSNLAVIFPPDSPPAFPSGEANPIWRQASNPANYAGWSSRDFEVLSYDMGRNPNLLKTASVNQREVKSFAATWQGYFWEDALVTTLGWRSDEVQSRGDTANTLAGNRLYLDLSPDEYYLAPYTEDRIIEEESISGGLVAHLNRFLPEDPLPIDISLSYNKSSNFQVGNIRSDLYGRPIPNPSGDTEDYGILLATKDGRYTFRAVKYKSEIANATVDLDTFNLRSAIHNGLNWRNVFLYDLGGYDWPTRNQPSYRNRASQAYPIDGGQKYQVAEGSAEELALEDAMIDAWNEIQAHLEENGFLAAWGMDNVTPSSELTNRSTYLANPEAWAPSNPLSVTTYASRSPQNFAVTGNTVSEGYEYEFTASPIDNWRISFNASKTEATNSDVGGQDLVDLIAYLDDMILGTPAGDLPRFGGASNSIGTSIYQNFKANYIRMTLQEGTTVPELRKWRYNVVTNYNFTDGPLAGVGVGGSYRWQDKVAIGYPLVPLTDDEYTFDIDSPHYGPTEDAIDLWVSYERQLTDNIDWRIQLNIRNAFADEELIPISIQPDNETWAAARIAPVQEWFITNTFSF